MPERWLLHVLTIAAVGSVVGTEYPNSQSEWYVKLAGVIPSGGTVGASAITVGANNSLGPCVMACDVAPSCQGFTVDTWATAPPTSCRLFYNATALLDAPCDDASPRARAVQYAAAFVKSGPGMLSLPYQQFAGLISPDRIKTYKTVDIYGGNLSVCVEACDTDPLCVGFQLLGCSPEAPGQMCWTMHATSVPRLDPVPDHACYYQKPGVLDVPMAQPTQEWTCRVPPPPHRHSPRDFDSGWSNGTKSFNCKMRKLAWEYGQYLVPEYAGFADLYHALGLNTECQDSAVPERHFTAQDWEPAPPNFPSLGTGVVLFVDYAKGADTNVGDIQSPKKTIAAAVKAASGQANATINLRSGRHYVAETVRVTAAHSGLTIQNYNGEKVVVSGGIPLTAQQWTPVKLPNGVDAYVADTSSLGLVEAPGLHVNGVRATRARFPNGNPELPEKGSAGGNEDGSVWLPGVASMWVLPDPSITQADVRTVSNPNTSQAVIGGLNGQYSTYTGGYGGWCSIYDPPFSYWCSSHRSGGGAHAPVKPRGVAPPPASVSPAGGNATAGLHLPYLTIEGAVIQSWHDDRWANWFWEVESYDSFDHLFTFGRGGFQESRGSGSGNGGDWHIENVFEELDSANEFFWNRTEQRLYFIHNGTGGPPPAGPQCEVPQVRTLFNLSASRWNPVRDVSIRGVTMTATRYTYLDPHGIPSAGDFAVVRRSGAVYLEGTERVKIHNCNLTRLDGNAIVVSGYNRDANISHNSISWVGDNGIVIWGRTNETAPNPIEGFDGTDGNHPVATRIEGNVIREIGIYTKQTSWIFQAKAALTLIKGNVLFNAPRNGLTFNDAFGGGDLTTQNLMLSALRESSDGGVWNSWNRQPFLTTYKDGSPSQYPAWRNVSHNFIINNYHGLVPIDADDGTAWVRMHHNYVAGGAWGFKNFFGHDKIFHENVNVFPWSNVLSIESPYKPGHVDLYFNNTVFIRDPALTAMVGSDFVIGHCTTGTHQVNVTNTKIYTGTGEVTWGCPLQYNATGNTVHKLPTEEEMIRVGRALLWNVT